MEETNAPLFIHIQDLPDSATHKDIRKFFGHLKIPEGGIFISGQNAFFSLKLEDEVAIGTFKAQCMFHGKMINYATVRRDEMEKILIRKVRRVLEFPLPNYSAKDYKTEVEYLLKLKKGRSYRRIRPTAVSKIKVGNPEPNKIFRPKESEFPRDSCAKNQQETAVRNTVAKKSRYIRRIHPTPVVEVDENELKRIFVVKETEKIQLSKKKKRHGS